jgi:hypothetical protein
MTARITITPPKRFGDPITFVADPDTDHLDVIAPAYLRFLTMGAPTVSVRYEMGGEDWTELHYPIGWRDGECVGTSVEYIDNTPTAPASDDDAPATFEAYELPTASFDDDDDDTPAPATIGTRSTPAELRAAARVIHERAANAATVDAATSVQMTRDAIRIARGRRMLAEQRAYRRRTSGMQDMIPLVAGVPVDLLMTRRAPAIPATGGAAYCYPVPCYAPDARGGESLDGWLVFVGIGQGIVTPGWDDYRTARSVAPIGAWAHGKQRIGLHVPPVMHAPSARSILTARPAPHPNDRGERRRWSGWHSEDCPCRTCAGRSI